jgi:aspartate-semialdehyde dehydrogenase
MRSREPVAILGATGSVGQQLVRGLHEHPWFEIAALVASDRSAGRSYGESTHWLLAEPIPAAIAAMPVLAAGTPLASRLVLSALPSEQAAIAEPTLAACGHVVVTNASPLRMDAGVPLVIPEVNPDHLGLLKRGPDGAGFVVANPNCATVGLVMALAPLARAFGISAVEVTSLQAVSGAGYPGVSGLDILGNVVPLIPGEEDKLESEPARILGRLAGDHIEDHPVRVSAQCTRVPVLDGHVLSVSVQLDERVPPDRVREALASFTGDERASRLPSAPESPLRLLDDGPWPQPRLHAGLGGGMTVSVGRLRPCPVLDVRFVALVHNTVRGAAGAALLNAELLIDEGLV